MNEIVGEGKWAAFRRIKPDKDIKTEMFSVTTPGTAPVVLGWIRWHSQWRKYVFTAGHDTILEEDCLRDIADFLVKQTTERRGTWKRRKSDEVEADVILGMKEHVGAE